MPRHSRTKLLHRVTLFVCSGCEPCDQAIAFLQGWINGRAQAEMQVIPIAQRPEKVVRMGIAHTPALVVNGELIAQNLTLDTLAEALRRGIDERVDS